MDEMTRRTAIGYETGEHGEIVAAPRSETAAGHDLAAEACH